MTNSERETNIYQNADDRSVWHIFTDDKVRIKEFRAKEYTIQKQVGNGFVFEVPARLITFRTAKRKARNGKVNSNTLSSKETSND